MHRLKHNVIAAILVFLAHHHIAFATISEHRSLPATLQNLVPPNVLINLSIETPMQGAAYNDQDDTASGGSCDGRNTETVGGTNYSVGDCFFEDKKYLGYFDPEKCYSHNGSYFVPIGGTDTGTYYCASTNGWSGNLLNWATMTAIDEFRWVMTGGNRVEDTAGSAGAPGITVLERANMMLDTGHAWFPVKKLTNAAVITRNTDQAYFPMYIVSDDYSMRYSPTLGGGTNISVRVQVCNPSVGGLSQSDSLEDNCRAYANGTYKPEGLIQQNSELMRFALISYLRDNTQERDGGVMRANMKYTGPQSPQAGGGLGENENREWDGTTGVQLDITDPDGLAALDGDINYSGIVNYINKFGANGYKSYDPISELFYEALNYYRRRGPTADYVGNLSAGRKDDFPVLNGTSYSSSAITGNFNWIDPITQSCQANYIVAINDANPWLDKRLPGSIWNRSTLDGAVDCFTPGTGGNPDVNNCLDYTDDPNKNAVRADSINVTSLTNTVGNLEGLTNICVGGTDTNWDGNASSKNVTGVLGRAMGTCPYVPKQNSYYIAGLAYWANTNDIRDDVAEDQLVKTFMVDTQEYSANPLIGNQNMLWLAAKYGGFIDSTGDNTTAGASPNEAGEWDENGDSEPDNYVLASSPEKLREGLLRHFNTIGSQVSAGASAAVISNTTDRIGLHIQALYTPQTVVNPNSNDRSVQWVGYLRALFKDEFGRLREDGNGIADPNGVLDDVATDPVVVLIAVDTGTQKVTRLFRCSTEPCNIAVNFTEDSLANIRPVWSADRQLRTLSNSGIETQRNNYSDIFSTNGNSRYILTWLGEDATVDPDDVVAFTTDAFQGDNRFWLNMENDSDNTGDGAVDQADADNLVNFIRGKDSSNDNTVNTRLRAPSLNPDDGVERLGDIIHSSPVAIDRPNGHYYAFYGDRSYLEYVNHWQNRRQVTYVGANDGMLHAFNGGFYNEAANSFSLTGDNNETAQPLGAELWGYVPRNLLPHLQWLARNDYPHISYVDGDVQVFDANIFDPDTDHVNGWGTILVANMRLGGNAIEYDHDNDSGTAPLRAASAVMIFDVTNPEVEPKLLAEFNDADLGFTIGRPALAYKRVPNDSTDPWNVPVANEWALVFGSGPDELSTATASAGKVPWLYRLNLNSLTSDGTIAIVDGTNPAKASLATGGFEGSYVGMPLAVNWNNDYQTDTIYVGLVRGDLANTTGTLKRVNMQYGVMGTWAASPVLDVTNQPFFYRPTVETRGTSKWVFAGSGRFLVQGDNLTNDQHSYYGIRESFTTVDYPYIPDSTTYSRSTNILDVTGYEVSDTTGALTATSGSNPLPGGVTTFSELRTLINDSYNGWYRDFSLRTADNGNERTTGSSVYARDFVVFTTYKTPLEACDAIGDGAIYGLYHETGTNHPTAGLRPPSSRFYPTPDSAPSPGATYVQYDDTFLHEVRYNAHTGMVEFESGYGENLSVYQGLGPLNAGRKSWREIILE